MPSNTPKRGRKKPDASSLFADPDEAPADRFAPHPELPATWAKSLSSEFGKPYFAELMRFVAKERTAHLVLPPEEDVYNAFRYTPLDQVRVVMLGQDPYPTPGHAHGLCFSVRPGVGPPASLRNIYKELHSDLGIEPVKHGYLAMWAKRGVFLLNTVLTVRAGKPASHARKGWETFTNAALRAVNDLPRPVVFILWGAHAQKKAELVDTKRHVVLASAHPSPLSAANGFFGSNPFSKTNAALIKAGEQTIDWRLPAEPVAE
jgi:uracil-DNA glycosylase